MAKIPMGNFGNAMPQVQRTQMPQDQSGQMIANTVHNVGQVAGQLYEQANAQEIQAKRLELFNNDVAEKEGQLKVDDFLSSKFSEQTTLLRNDVANGVKTKDQADAELRIWADDQYKDLSTSLPIHAQQRYKAQIDSAVGRQGAGFLPLELKANEQKSVSLIDQAFSIATRLPTEKREAYLNSYLDTAPISEVDKSNYRQKLKVESNKIDIDGRITTAINASSTEDLTKLSTELGEGKYPYLNGGQVQDYQASISSRIHTLQQRKQVEENKRLGESSKVLNEFKQSVLTGRAMDQSYVDNVRTAVQGTQNQEEFEFYISQSKNFQDFSKLSTAEQLKKLNAQKAIMKNVGTEHAVREQKVMNVYQAIYDEKAKNAKDNPNQLLAESGIQLPDINPVEMKMNPQSFAKNIVEIGSYQLALKTKDPNVTIKPISPEVLPEAVETFDKSTVDQKLNLISNIIGQSKDINGGKQLWEQTLKQLGGGSLNYVAAGTARLNNFRSTEGRDLATSIISGTQLLKNKQFTMPKEADMRAVFNDYVGQTVSGETANNAYEVFKAVYADTMQSRGFNHEKADELPNKEIVKTSLGMATGGVYDQGGTFRNYMGSKYSAWKVTKPYGMTDGVFEAKLNKGYADLSKQTGISVAELKGFRLRQGSSSSNNTVRYDLINERDAPLLKDGGVWWINVDKVTK